MNLDFEILRVHSTLSIVRMKSAKTVIGYINKHPDEGSWFYFMQDFISQFYDSEQIAAEELLRHFVTTKLNNQAAQQIEQQNKQIIDKKLF